ncbi:MAG: YihY/virulence factor BrkB family protein [Planctomycetota bacterium]|nr:YihY/virulence factor BrkB family protein [Planctomycetota bacterium]
MSQTDSRAKEESETAIGQGYATVTRLWSFASRVVSHFFANKGLLLAGSVAYNSLLSIIPLCAVFLVFLSRFFEQEKVLEVIHFQLDFITPGQTEILLAEIRGILAKREFVEGIGIFFMLFFSSLAFKTLEDAIAVIYNKQFPKTSSFKIVRVFKRDFWISAVIPYAFIASIGIILLLGTFFISFLENFSGRQFLLFGSSVKLDPIWNFGFWALGFAVQVLMFASIYKVMPTIKIEVRRAVIGGFSAAVLWEIVRRVVSWYFANVSMVGRVYGSLTAVVVILLMMEVGSLIVLLGAQIMAELRWSEAAGLPWYEGAPSYDEIQEDEDPKSIAVKSPARKPRPQKKAKRKKRKRRR